MVRLHTAATDALSPALVQKVRALLDAGFDGRFTDDDWEHAIGGMHAYVIGPTGLISHGSVVERTLICAGVPLSIGYVEAVATAASHRRQGHGTTVMRQLGALIREDYQLGALSTGTHAFYATLGWESWRGPTLVEGPQGRTRTPADDDDVMILRTPQSPRLDLGGEIICDWRSGDVW